MGAKASGDATAHKKKQESDRRVNTRHAGERIINLVRAAPVMKAKLIHQFH